MLVEVYRPADENKHNTVVYAPADMAHCPFSVQAVSDEDWRFLTRFKVRVGPDPVPFGEQRRYEFAWADLQDCLTDAG